MELGDPGCQRGNFPFFRPVAHVHLSVSKSLRLARRPSLIGYISKAVALVGQGEKELAFETFDLCFRDCGADEIRFLLLIKVRSAVCLSLLAGRIRLPQAILLFVSGKREHAVTRVNDLMAVSDDSTMYNCLQARSVFGSNALTTPLTSPGSCKYVPDARRLGTRNAIVRTCTVAVLLPPRLSSGDDPAGKLMIVTYALQGHGCLTSVGYSAGHLKNSKSRFVAL